MPLPNEVRAHLQLDPTSGKWNKLEGNSSPFVQHHVIVEDVESDRIISVPIIKFQDVVVADSHDYVVIDNSTVSIDILDRY